MSQEIVLKIRGLYQNSNELSGVPEGALSRADNLVINQDSVAESRRGFTRLPFTLPLNTDRVDKLYQFQNSLLAHYSSTQIAYYNSGTGFNIFSGSFSSPDPVTDKIRSAEANSNFYFTSSTGVKKLDSLSNSPIQAGMYKGLDAKASLSTNASGFFLNNSQVAYRVVWGILDANKNLIVGFPSQRAIIANASGGLSDVSLQITIPTGVTVNHYFDIYRSSMSASSTTVPFDDGQLVYEGNPTSGQITAKSITIIDSTPDTLRGAALYTNATQDGILQANELPPYCTDLATFKNSLFFANTKTKQQLNITMLAVGGSSGVAVGDTLTVAGTTYTGAAAENVATLNFVVVTTGSPSQNINDTCLSLIRVVNQNATNTQVYAFYQSTPLSLPGQMLFEERVLGGGTYSATASAHGSAYSKPLPTSGTAVSSSNNVNLNGLMYSKTQIPEAVPIGNIFYVGSASKRILRIIPLRDSLFILKEDGVYRLTGQTPANFTVDLLDNTAFLIAPESAVTLNNKIYALTTQGVVEIVDNGVSIISRPIENVLSNLFQTSLTTLKNVSFGIGYESERKYILFINTNSGDTVANQAFVYNYITKSWTRWTRTQTHGIVLISEDKLYCADPLSNNVNQERKTGTYQDYSDEALPVNINSYIGVTLTLNDVSNVVVGDSIYQSLSLVSIVTAINPANSTVTVTDITFWTVGGASLLKSIPCLLQWVPAFAGNAGTLKHWREATLLLKQNYFNTASLNFYSDVSGGVEVVTFPGLSGAGWGRFTWGNGALWGGVANTLPIRTYIPREKQRCDLLSVQFACQNTWARFAVEGLSLVLNPGSSRVSK